MTDILEQARAALDGATEGPWTEHVKGNGHPNSYVCGAPEECEWGESMPVVAYIVGMNVEENRRFIAAARQLVPDLIAEVEKVRAERDAVDIHTETENARLRARVAEVWEEAAKLVDAKAAKIEADEADSLTWGLTWGGPDPRGADARHINLQNARNLRKTSSALRDKAEEASKEIKTEE